MVRLLIGIITSIHILEQNINKKTNNEENEN